MPFQVPPGDRRFPAGSWRCHRWVGANSSRAYQCSDAWFRHGWFSFREWFLWRLFLFCHVDDAMVRKGGPVLLPTVEREGHVMRRRSLYLRGTGGFRRTRGGVAGRWMPTFPRICQRSGVWPRHVQEQGQPGAEHRVSAGISGPLAEKIRKPFELLLFPGLLCCHGAGGLLRGREGIPSRGPGGKTSRVSGHRGGPRPRW